MKKEEIIKNLTEVYNVLMDELSEEQISKFGYSEEIKPEDFCQFIFSRADSIAYEELDKDYVGGGLSILFFQTLESDRIL